MQLKDYIWFGWVDIWVAVGGFFELGIKERMN